MRQSSAGSLDSIPGSETSSLSDQSRDLSRSEEESSLGKLSEQSTLPHEKHDDTKDISLAEETTTDDDVIIADENQENNYDDLIKPEIEEEKKDAEKDTLGDDRDIVGDVRTTESQEGDEGTIQGERKTVEDETRSLEEDVDTEVATDLKEIEGVDEPAHEIVGTSLQTDSDDVTAVDAVTRDSTDDDADVNRNADATSNAADTPRDSDVVEDGGEHADVTGFTQETVPDKDKYSSKFDDILDKLEECEDTSNDSGIIGNETEEKKSVEDCEGGKTVENEEYEKIDDEIDNDEEMKTNLPKEQNGTMSEETTNDGTLEIQERKDELKERSLSEEELNKSVDGVENKEESSEKESNEKLGDNDQEMKDITQENSPMKQLSPGKP